MSNTSDPLDLASHLYTFSPKNELVLVPSLPEPNCNNDPPDLNIPIALDRTLDAYSQKKLVSSFRTCIFI